MHDIWSADKPEQPANGVFPPEGWTVGTAVPVRGQDDGKKLWSCTVVPMEYDGPFGSAYLTWTEVEEVEINVRQEAETAPAPGG